MFRPITLAILLLAASLNFCAPASAQTTTNCQWIGNVWTCNQSAPPPPAPQIDWSRANNNGFNDSFRQGMAIGESIRRVRQERERMQLEQDRLELERDQLEQRRLENEQSAQSRLPESTQHPPYMAKWLEKAEPRMGLYPNYSEIVFAQDVPITQDMVMLMSSSDYAADIAYYLATHKVESMAIAKLPLLEAAKALSDIEQTFKDQEATE